MTLCGKVVGLWKRLEGLRQLDRLTIWHPRVKLVGSLRRYWLGWGGGQPADQLDSSDKCRLRNRTTPQPLLWRTAPATGAPGQSVCRGQGNPHGRLSLSCF